jgi:hypothetical protein
VVPPLSLKNSPPPCLATNLSSEVLTWFIDDSSKETSSSVSSSSFYSFVSSCCESEESSSSPLSSESRSLFINAEVSGSSSNLCLPLLSLDAVLLTRESVGRERVIGGGRGDQKCRVGDGSGNGVCTYLLMEKGLVIVAAWSWRTKRHRLHFLHTRLIIASANMKKGRVHYNRLFFASEEVSTTTNFVCPSIPYDELAA